MLRALTTVPVGTAATAVADAPTVDADDRTGQQGGGGNPRPPSATSSWAQPPWPPPFGTGETPFGTSSRPPRKRRSWSSWGGATQNRTEDLSIIRPDLVFAALALTCALRSLNLSHGYLTAKTPSSRRHPGHTPAQFWTASAPPGPFAWPGRPETGGPRARSSNGGSRCSGVRGGPWRRLGGLPRARHGISEFGGRHR